MHTTRTFLVAVLILAGGLFFVSDAQAEPVSYARAHAEACVDRYVVGYERRAVPPWNPRRGLAKASRQ